jgi:hypothetical protein
LDALLSDPNGGPPADRTDLETESGVWATAANGATPTVGLGSATPEPASWSLLVVGFAGLGASLRSSRRRRSVA